MNRRRPTRGPLALAGVAVLAAVAAVAATAGGSVDAPARVNGKAVLNAMEISSNWAGYVATGLGSTPTTASATTQYKSVTATWKQPKLTCPATGVTSTSAAIWVGLGGYSTRSTALEQTGTSADCVNGKATYYGWYEIVPDPSITIKNLKVNPGDTLTASVVINGNEVLFWLKNRTRNAVFSKRVTVTNPDLTSAEWIAEAPSECSSNGYCRQIPLANFGSVTFTKVAALASVSGLGDQGGTISSTLWQSTPVQLVPRPAQRFFGDAVERPDSTTGSAGATPLNLAGDGASFSVNWVANATAG